MNILNPLKKEFWTHVGIGLFLAIMSLGVLLIISLILSCIWWIVTHGAWGLIITLVIILSIFCLSILGRLANYS
jgi:hypothetical protein